MVLICLYIKYLICVIGLPLRFAAYETVEKLLERLSPPLLLSLSNTAAVSGVRNPSEGSIFFFYFFLFLLKVGGGRSSSAAQNDQRRETAAVSTSSARYLTVSSSPLFDYEQLFNSICLNGLVDEG
jgi:hypothetical protein